MSTLEIERIHLPAQHYLYVEGEAGADGSGIAEAMGAGFGAVYEFVAAHGITPTSMPTAIYVNMPSPEGMFFRLGFFVTEADAAKANGTIKADTIVAGDAYKAVHVGPYPELHQTHTAIWNHMDGLNVERGLPVWEHYIDDPSQVDEAAMRTEVFRMAG